MDDLTGELNALGRDGWEAIGLTEQHSESSGSTFAVLLKRPVLRTAKDELFEPAAALQLPDAGLQG
jgi:hypothetical protein